MRGKDNSSSVHNILTVIGCVLCVILLPMLIINCTILIKSFINKDEVPDFGGFIPFIILTDSMYPDIKSGALVICIEVDPKEVEKGDVISFYDPSGNGKAVVTHKVVDIINEDGKLSFKTKGINNNTEDRFPVPAEKVIAEYSGLCIPGAGNAAIFLQSPAGLVLCVILPIILLVGYDVLRRRIYDKRRNDDMAKLMAELEKLRNSQNKDKMKS